jgi:hypothetical protein
MDNQFNYKQINWIDGMKIDKNHFIGLENHFIACIADVRRMFSDPFSYGLLPQSVNQEKNPDFELFLNDQNILNVKLLKCAAITPAGFGINISDSSSDSSKNIDPNIETKLNLTDYKEKEFYLVISVNPFLRIPAGWADSSENPLRQPFVIPEYKLNIVPATGNITKNLGSDLLPLGKFAVVNNKPEIDKTYIPPCSAISSHLKLLEFHTFVNQSVNSLEKNVVELISEINQKTTSNVVINIIQCIAENILYYLNNKIVEFNWFMVSKPPAYLIAGIVSLARSVKNAFDSRTPEEREKLLNYLSDHFDINPAKFKQLLDVTIGIEYHHNDVNQSMEKAEDFINVISLLINELKKMEFIVGEKKKKKIDIVIR